MCKKPGLSLSFSIGEAPQKPRPLTGYEINELSIAAQGIKTITRAMSCYSDDNPDMENPGYASVFNVLEWLIGPIVNYLDEYAGEPAAPETSGEE
jgi:hypothetical protein